MAFRREQLSMEEKRIEAEQKRQAQMQEQFLNQQRQLQQHMQAQAQSQALLMTLRSKMNKSLLFLTVFDVSVNCFKCYHVVLFVTWHADVYN